MRTLLAAVLLALAALPARAASRTWIGGASGDWKVPGNWSGSAVPGPADDASITGGFVIAYATDPAVSVKSLTLGPSGVLRTFTGVTATGAVTLQTGAALQFGATASFVVGTFSLAAGSSATYNGPPIVSGTVPALHLQPALFSMAPGSTVTVKGTGYAGGVLAAGKGPGAGGAGSGGVGAGGAGHGGAGGNGGLAVNAGTTYDSLFPTDGGSGGGGAPGGSGGAGGGVLIIDASTADVNGLLSADGETGVSLGLEGGGGAAGGAVIVRAAVLTGSGTVTANGGGGGAGANAGGGGGGGGFVWLRESSGYAVFHSTLTLQAAGGAGGVGGTMGTAGSSGSLFYDPRHWTGAGTGTAASTAGNWSASLVPRGGEAVVFGGSTTATGCTWDLGPIAIGSVTVLSSWQATLTVTSSMTPTGSFSMAGGTVAAGVGMALAPGGAVLQTGGRLDLVSSTLTLAGYGASVSASFSDARVGSLVVGGGGAATATVSGLLEVVSTAQLLSGGVLSHASGTLRFDGAGPFVGAGSVNASTGAAIVAYGASTQTWTAWPGIIGTFRSSNASGLILSPANGARFAVGGGVVIDTGAFLTAGKNRVEVAGDWSNYGTVLMTGSTVAFNAASGTQTVTAGGNFDNLIVDDAGATLTMTTWTVVGTSVSLVSGVFDLGSSTIEVLGSWYENPGAALRPGRGVAIFDGFTPQTVFQLNGNSFGSFRSSSTATVSISSTLATASSFEWHRGNLSYTKAALTIGGDMLFKGGISVTVAGSTVVFNGASTQTVTFNTFSDFVDANTSAAGVRLGVNMSVNSFQVRPGSVIDGQGSAVTAAGPVWDTAFSTYLAQNPFHTVLWQPASAITVGAGSLINGQVTVSANKTVNLLGDLNITGSGSKLDPRVGVTIVNAVGGSTIAFRGGADLIPSNAANWFYAGDAANSWLVFEGSGTHGSSISTNTYGSVRIGLATTTDTFRAPNLNMSGNLVIEGGTFKPFGSPTIAVGGGFYQGGAGLIDFGSVSTGTILLTGPSTQTVRLLNTAHSLWHLTSVSTGTVQAASDLIVRGDLTITTGTFAGGSGALRVEGKVLIATAAAFAGQTSTFTLNGAAGGRTSQSLAFFGSGAFNGLSVNVQNATLLTGATAAVFTDPFAGGSLTVAAGSQLTAGDLRLGNGVGANLTAQSSIPGSPWYLRVGAVSSATAVTASDSNAAGGASILANDGRSVDAGGNSNWIFKPQLLVLLPGETYTPGSSPGKTGTPSVSTAGASITVTVMALSSRYDVAFASTGTVTLTSDDPFATFGATASLVGGTTTLTVTPFAAEPSPRQTRVFATTFFGSGVSTVPVVSAGLARLQILLPGEAAVPGSVSGRSGAPFPRVKGIPFSATIRAVDQYWNAVTTVTDSYALTTSASSSTLPAPPAMVGGLSTASGLVIYSTGLFTLSAFDLTQPIVTAATSSVFGVAPPSVSSPTASFYVPTGAAIATLGGALAGTAADGSSVARVRVDILEIETGFHFDGVLKTFSSAVSVFSTTTLASPLAPSTSWSNPIPDSALTSGRHYGATALVDDPSGFTGVAASTFVVDRTALLFGSASGQGTAAASPSTASGCEPVVTTVTFTVGASGVGPGGAVAIRAPDGWTVPAGVTTQRPPPSGFWNVISTSLVSVAGSSTVVVNPPAFGAQTLGAGWLLVSVPTNSANGFLPGQKISFTYAGTPPASPAGRGGQTFAVWSAGDGTGPLAPISTQPVVNLNPGTTSFVAFVDATPLNLGPLQAAPTIQLKVVDACGNDKLGVSSGTASLSLVVPVNGGYATDATAQFFAANGTTITTVGLSTGIAYSPGFTVVTSTSGPSSAYIRASAIFPVVSTGIVTVAMRPVRLTASAVNFSSVSVDAGTLTPGATSAAFSASAPDSSGVRLVFTLPDPGLNWDAVLSTDAVSFGAPVFHATGAGDAGKPVVLSWDGVDRVSSPPRFAPAGHYRARLSAGGGTALNTSVEIVVPPTAGYDGVTSLPGASVRASGPGAGEGSFAQASATGYFLLRGLRAGQPYQITATTTTTVGGAAVALSTAFAAPAAAASIAHLGTVSFLAPAAMRVSAILPVPAPFDAVGGFVARAADGSAAFTGALRFSTGAATSDDGGPLFGRAASTWTTVQAAPGTYSFEISIPDLNLSTAVAGVTLGAAGADLIVPLDRRAGVGGFVVLASSVAGGTTVSVAATLAGDPAPSAFAAAVATGTSAAYALYGLAPGTWTLTATSPGFVSASSVVVVTGANDLTGVNFALGGGGSINGSVTVTGDSTRATQCFPGASGAAGSCPAGTFDLSVEALAVGGADRAATRVRVTGNASSASAPFSIGGLTPGLWTVRTSLPGFVVSPASGAVVSVAAASASTATIGLAAANARAAVTVQLAALPGGACRAPTAWSALGLTFDTADGASRVYGDATAVSGGGAFQVLNCSSATFFSPALPPGTLRAGALFAPTGAWATGRALLTDGATAALTLDLTASSVPVQGSLSVSGLISVTTRAAGGAPFAVAASSAAGVLSATPGVSFCLLGSKDPVARQALRAELVPYDPNSGTPSLRRATGGAGSCAAPAASTGAATSLGFAAFVNADGSFSFGGVQPGLYLLRVPGDLDDDPSNGAEAVGFSKLVTVGASGAVLSPVLGRGARISGRLSSPAGAPAGRQFRVALIAPDGSEARATVVTPPSGGAASFSFDGVADGAYRLTADDLATPRAYFVPGVAATVAGSDVTGLSLAAAAAGTVRARLSVVRVLPDGTQQATLVTKDNAALLPAGFAATAASLGGTYSLRAAPDGSFLDAQGRVVLDGLPPDSYDLSFSAPSDPGALAVGGAALAPARVAGVAVAAGQAVDLGVVALFSGAFVSGTVTDASTGRPVAGLRVSARPSDAAGAAPGAASGDTTAVTDAAGAFVLRGLDPSRRWFDVTAAPRGAMTSGAPLPPYAARRALAVDVSSGATVNFALSPAAATIRGKVVAAGGATLTATLGPGDPASPGAAVTLQAGGANPSDDPLADLIVRTNPDGTFVIPSVATGSYRFTAAAIGQGAVARAVVVTTSAVDLGTVNLGAGAGLSGALRLPDGTAPSASEVQAVAAVSPDSSEFAYAALSNDASGRVSGYAVGGLTPGRTYRLVVTGPGGTTYVPPEAASVVVASSSDARALDLTLRPTGGPVSFRATRNGARWEVTASFARPLRSRFAADSDASVILTTAAATGVLSGGTISADRLSVSAIYDPGPGETSAVLRASAAVSAVDWSSTDPSARELIVGATTALRLAGDGLTRASMTNGVGGALTLDGDAGRLVLPRGAFAVDAASSVAVSLTRSASPAAFAAAAPPAAAAGPYYDVTLAGGVPTTLSKAATLTLAYSTSVVNPSRLNVYWFNPAAGAYILQPDALGGPLVVDQSARTVTLRVGHFSTYVLLDSAVGVIGGSAFAGGDLDAYNFPNPFDLSVKTVTTIHGGGTPSVRGTLIRVSVPPGLSGSGTLKVFDVTGRLVRSIDLGSLTGGQIYYQGWDGRNDSGLDVASGLYLGQVVVGGRKKTFKMAVLK